MVLPGIRLFDQYPEASTLATHTIACSDTSFCPSQHTRRKVGYRVLGRILFFGAGVAACGSSGGALAQDAIPADGDEGTPAIVVTGSKLGSDPQRQARSLQILSSEDLASRGIQDVAGLAKVVPGLTFTRSTYGVPVYSIRGIGYFDNSLTAPPAVAIYIDEAPLPYSALSTGAALDLTTVEVAKGPQGTLFGQNSTGGAINFVSAKPTDRLSVGLSSDIDSFGQFTNEGFVSGPIAANLKMRLSARYERGGDWQENDRTGEKRGGKDLLIARLLTQWNPAHNLDILLNINGWRDRSDTQAGQLVTLRGASPPLPQGIQGHPAGVRNNRLADWSDDGTFARDADYYQAYLRVFYRLENLTITSITSWQHLSRDDTSDSDGTNFQLLQSRTPGRVSIFSQELRARLAQGPVKWMVGGNFQRERVKDELALTIKDSSFPFDAIQTKTRHRNRSWAVFANLDVDVTDRLTLEGGGRYTDERRRFQGCSYDGGDGSLAAYVGRVATTLSGTTVNIPAGGCVSLSDRLLPAVTDTEFSDRNWSWRAGFKWSLRPAMMLYANVSRGQKSAAFPTVAGTVASQFAPAKPESVIAYEVGAKATGFGGRVHISAAAFHYDYRDKQVRGKTIDPNIGPVGALVNITRSSVWGGEVTVDAEPLKGVDLAAGMNLTSSSILGPFLAYDAYGRRRDLGGEPFPLTPKWQLFGNMGYRRTVGSGGSEVFAGASIKYQSGTNADLGEIAALYLNPYAIVDLRAGVTVNGSWTVQAYVTNVADQKYGTFTSTVSPDVNVRFTGMPRTFGLRASYRL